MPFNFQPPVIDSYAVSSVRDNLAEQTAHNTENTAELIQELKADLQKEKNERIASEKKMTVLSVTTIIIAALTLIATIVVPLMLQR